MNFPSMRKRLTVLTTVAANTASYRKVDTVRRILYFDETVFCTYTKRVAKDIKRLLQLKTYRKYIGGMAYGPDADASV